MFRFEHLNSTCTLLDRHDQIYVSRIFHVCAIVLSVLREFLWLTVYFWSLVHRTIAFSIDVKDFYPYKPFDYPCVTCDCRAMNLLVAVMCLFFYFLQVRLVSPTPIPIHEGHTLWKPADKIFASTLLIGCKPGYNIRIFCIKTIVERKETMTKIAGHSSVTPYWKATRVIHFPSLSPEQGKSKDLKQISSSSIARRRGSRSCLYVCSLRTSNRGVFLYWAYWSPQREVGQDLTLWFDGIFLCSHVARTCFSGDHPPRELFPEVPTASETSPQNHHTLLDPLSWPRRRCAHLKQRPTSETLGRWTKRSPKSTSWREGTEVTNETGRCKDEGMINYVPYSKEKDLAHFLQCCT